MSGIFREADCRLAIREITCLQSKGKIYHQFLYQRPKWTQF